MSFFWAFQFQAALLPTVPQLPLFYVSIICVPVCLTADVLIHYRAAFICLKLFVNNKTKLQLVPPANNNRRRQCTEKMRALRKYSVHAVSSKRGKTRARSHNWFWFYFNLVDKVAKRGNGKPKQFKTHLEIYGRFTFLAHSNTILTL